jgi:hypothetical protein
MFIDQIQNSCKHLSVTNEGKGKLSKISISLKNI